MCAKNVLARVSRVLHGQSVQVVTLDGIIAPPDQSTRRIPTLIVIAVPQWPDLQRDSRVPWTGVRLNMNGGLRVFSGGEQSQS